MTDNPSNTLEAIGRFAGIILYGNRGIMEFSAKMSNNEWLSGYWPAAAYKHFLDGHYAQAVHLCQIHQENSPETLSGKIILARALYHSGQYEMAEQHFYEILRRDPENLAALKYLGDIKFRTGDEITAMSFYNRVLEIDPMTAALAARLQLSPEPETKIIVLKKSEENIDSPSGEIPNLKEIPFKTETIGDLLMAQGHHRLAMEVFKELARAGNPRLADKLNRVKEILNNQKG